MYHPTSTPCDPVKVQEQSIIVEQLRREASFKRIPVSQAIEDLKKYVIDNQHEDILLTGFNNVKQNPYFKKSSCTCELIWINKS